MQRYYLAIGTITLSGFGLWLALTITDSPEHAKDALVDTISTTTPNSLITSECQEYYENIFPNAPEYGTFAEYNTSTSTTAPTTTEVTQRATRSQSVSTPTTKPLSIIKVGSLPERIVFRPGALLVSEQCLRP